jgi:hypothetical protein
MDPDLEAKLLPGMPSLFSTSLPPCGLEFQLAYENVLHRLRCIWLHHAADPSIDTPNVADICKLVKRHLELEQHTQPLNTGGPRKPWRREWVFMYELRWANYFVREAQLLHFWPEMSEKQKERMQFAFKVRPMPKELAIVIRKRETENAILNLWVAWSKWKRADLVKIDEQLVSEKKVKEEQAEADMKKEGEDVLKKELQEGGDEQAKGNPKVLDLQKDGKGAGVGREADQKKAQDQISAENVADGQVKLETLQE